MHDAEEQLLLKISNEHVSSIVMRDEALNVSCQKYDVRFNVNFKEGSLHLLLSSHEDYKGQPFEFAIIRKRDGTYWFFDNMINHENVDIFPQEEKKK